MKKRHLDILMVLIVCFLAVGIVICSRATIAFSVETDVDGQGAQMPAGGTHVTGWSVVRDNDFVYFTFSGTSANEWDKSYLNGNAITLSYPNQQGGGSNNVIQFTYNQEMKDGWYNDIPGASITVSDTSVGSEGGVFQVSCVIPVSFFADTNYTMTFCGSSIESDSIVNLAGEAPTETTAEQPTETTAEQPTETTAEQPTETTAEQPTETTAEQPTETTAEKPTDAPAYTGIVIDGSYADWDAVGKVPAGDSFHEPSYLVSGAAVYDGDFAYIYVEDIGGMAGTGAGPFNNGKYSITSDYGYQVIFQLTRDNGGSIAGIDGATCVYNNNKWEIAIPKSQLPKNNGTISVGLYGTEPFTTVSNLQGGGNIGDATFNGIVYDGLYGDWTAYPHTLIQYATAGTQDSRVDGEGALYAQGSDLYGHVISSMSAHVSEGGGEFTSAVTIRLNQDASCNVYPRCVLVDAAGNINWNPQMKNLAEGTYEFYLMDMNGWGNSTNINNLTPGDRYLGKMMITIGSTVDEMEFIMDIESMAAKFGMNATDIHTIQAKFGKIGQRWIETAGASTGTVIGIVLCLAVVGAVWMKRRKAGEII